MRTITTTAQEDNKIKKPKLQIRAEAMNAIESDGAVRVAGAVRCIRFLNECEFFSDLLIQVARNRCNSGWAVEIPQL